MDVSKNKKKKNLNSLFFSFQKTKTNHIYMELQTFGYRILFVSSKADNELYEFDNYLISSQNRFLFFMVLLSVFFFLLSAFTNVLLFSVSSCAFFAFMLFLGKCVYGRSCTALLSGKSGSGRNCFCCSGGENRFLNFHFR